MYRLKPGIKNNPEKRWNLPDRVFFGHGACHILAGVYLRAQPLLGFYAERLIPVDDFSGNHIYVTNGSIAFDYHGYSVRQRLLRHHRCAWSNRYQGWDARIEKVDFPLLETKELNARKMLGPDQYFRDPVPRAEQFIARINHVDAMKRAEILTNSI